MQEHKGKIFDGFFSGANYDLLASLGNISEFYRNVAREIALQPGMHVLDLGCGTGTFALMVAPQIGPTGHFFGVDLSEKQLAHARQKTSHVQGHFTFFQQSIDELPFEDHTFDRVVSLTTFHHVPSLVRRRAIRETARVLKPGGSFALVDLNKPQPGLGGFAGFLLYLLNGFDPMLHDHWYNTFPDLCKTQHLLLTKDTYLTPFIRCQIFHKQLSSEENL